MPDLEKSEYESLYREIQDNASRVLQIIGVCVTGSTALISYVFTINPKTLPFEYLLPPFLLLIPFLVMIPSMLLIQASLHSTVRIAAYLIVRYERDASQVRWQTTMQKYRETYDFVRWRPFRFALVSVFGGLGVASLAASSVALISAANMGALPHALAAGYGVLSCSLLCVLVVGLIYSWKGWGRGSFSEEIARMKRVIELCKVEA